MEGHPIMFLFLIVIWAFYAVYHIIKAIVIVTIALCKWISKKIRGRRVNNNVVNR